MVSEAAAPTQRLAVTRLTLTRFRCYGSLRLLCDERPVVLAGPNGAGKTNLLEALSFLAPGRGLRRAKPEDLPQRDRPPSEAGGWAVAATLMTPEGPVDIGTGRGSEPAAAANDRAGTAPRSVRINGAPARRQAALAEVVGMIWLTPEMDRLFVDSASARRRFLDRVIYGFDADHAGRVAAYENAMRQRLRLLRAGPRDPSWLTALEARMAEQGVAIAAARREIVGRLDRACGRGLGPFPRAGLGVDGLVEGWLDEMPALAAEERLGERLAGARAGDGESGRTSAGPHLSDLVVRYLPKDVPAALASTGEQKALLIAIVLATARLVAEARGAAPLLLMDEVAAHLDAARRTALFDEIVSLGCQAWLTGTDAALFAPLGDSAQHFRVEHATVCAAPAGGGQ